MNNYEYVVASLPVLSPDGKLPDGLTPERILSDIREQLSEGDRACLDFLLREDLTPGHYAAALRHRDPFIRAYSRFDLHLRNAKVRYLNRQLGRPAEQDVMTGVGEDGEVLFEAGAFDRAAEAEAALAERDILARERALDALTWSEVDALTTFDYFDLDAVLGFAVKLRVVSRWCRLDPDTGRELFRRLVDEVRGTFQGVKYNADKIL